jgi:hypothetical protein
MSHIKISVEGTLNVKTTSTPHVGKHINCNMQLHKGKRLAQRDRLCGVVARVLG